MDKKEELRDILSSDKYSYLSKIFYILDYFTEDKIDATETETLAKEFEINWDDLMFIFEKFYKIDDTTPLVRLIKITENPNSTYFDKCLAIADVFAYGGITEDDTVKIAEELRVDYEDVINILKIKYKESIDSANRDSKDNTEKNPQPQNEKEPTQNDSQADSNSSQKETQEEKNDSKDVKNEEEKSILDEIYSLVKKEGEEIAKDIKDKIISKDDGKVKFDFGSLFKNSDKK